MPRPFIPAPNTALVEMVYTYGGQVIENTFHVQKSTPFTAGDLSVLANTFDTWDSTGALKWSTLRNQGCVLQQIKTKALDTISSPVFIFVLPVARAGLTASAPLPGNLSFAITLQTGLAGRSQRGRIYFPGIAAGQISGVGSQNSLQSAVANNMVILVNNLIAAIAALSASHKLVVTSFRSGNAWRAVAQNTVVTNAAYANLVVDTQRRRTK
jgi:hypothetical protein